MCPCSVGDRFFTLNLSQVIRCTSIHFLQKVQASARLVIDASAKFPYSGILDSGRTEFGNFDECIGIDDNVDGVKILGKYCYAGLILPDLSNLTNIDSYYKLGTCIPDACSAQDLLTIMESLAFEGFPSIFIDNFCTTKETGKEFSAGNILVISILSIIVAAVLITTLYEFYCIKNDEKAVHPLLIAFSLINNTKNLLKISRLPNKETIEIFNGFRSISIAWVVLGHTAMSASDGYIPVTNNDYVVSLRNSRASTYIFGANFAVSTFFFMSGFLVSYLYFKKKSQSWLTQVKTIPSLYAYRYIRLTLPLLILFLIIIYAFEKVGSGPLWHSGCETEINNCKQYWWSYFLYLQNYTNWNQLCLIPLWYLSADMQLFLVSPLILLPTSWILTKPNGFKLSMIILTLINVLFVLVHIGIREVFPESTENDYGTHGRVAEYFIGMMMGVFMRFKKDELFMGAINKKLISVFNIIIWIIVLTIMFAIWLFSEDAIMKFDRTNQTLFFAFGRAIWAIGLSWMVYSCYNGYGAEADSRNNVKSDESKV